MNKLSIIRWATILFVIAYLPRIRAWFGSIHKQEELKNPKQNRLALIIPARNEGEAVMPLFNSIAEQTYPHELFDTYVVVKDYNDPVHEYGKTIGATVYTDEDQTCKGDCLDYTIKKILKDKPDTYDGYLIVDADCVLAPDFMEQMNNAMLSGADVINAKKLVKNYFTGDKKDCNMVTSCNGLIWTLMDDMGNRFKSDHGYTTMTITTGILLSKKLVEGWGGWIYKETLTEDMELQRDCAAKGIKTFYYSHAKFYMEESPLLSVTNKRRRRWMTGLTDADKIYFKPIMKNHSLHGIKNAYYMYCLWISYFYYGFLSITGILNLAMAAVLRITVADGYMPYLCYAATAIIHIYLTLLVLSAVAVWVDRKNIKLSFFKKIELILIHPLFYMQYFKIVAKAILGTGEMQWEEITRIEAN